LKGKHTSVALLGNPNSGKSSLFNQLTGLNQKVGNFPGVTVEKKTGRCRLCGPEKVEIIDLPGTYSLYPRSMDERVVFNTLIDPDNPDFPDLVVVIADASNIKRNLLLFTQVKDLGIPVILALNMIDVATNLGQRVNPTLLAKAFDVPVVSINGRTGQGIPLLRQAISDHVYHSAPQSFDALSKAPALVKWIKTKYELDNDYQAYLMLHQYPNIDRFSDSEKDLIKQKIKELKFQAELAQSQETIERYKAIDKVIDKAVVYNLYKSKNLTRRLDRIFTHKVFGYLIFFLILFLIFQSIFSWASAPMDYIDLGFSKLSNHLQEILPEGVLVDLLTEGIIPGIGGVLIFIPQIALLFAFISILEESGYMSRVVFLMDRFMRRFGLNGRSLVPLISGVACAIPAILATRTIDNWKERLITILVIPFMSCSARLPVYTILIALVVPEEKVFGLLNLQGLVLMGMYLLGFFTALISAVIMHFMIRIREQSYLIMELPLYKFPRWKNVGLTIYEKSREFAMEAGKIIMAISIILWVAASYGPGDKVRNAEKYVNQIEEGKKLDQDELRTKVESFKLKNSYAGIFGRFIEPVIKPLGYDWKIGIAIITSFAAREVFVGTMATIYSIGAEDEGTIKSRMKAEFDPETGQPVYTPASAFSLLLFYAFAMQCMSTLAVVKKETNSWKWPLIQLFLMTGLAYVSALAAYSFMK
jgi:ferrous iron transport protein B